MPSPFPGMDPYLEGHLWPDVHSALGVEAAAPGLMSRTMDVSDAHPLVLHSSRPLTPSACSSIPSSTRPR